MTTRKALPVLALSMAMVLCTLIPSSMAGARSSRLDDGLAEADLAYYPGTGPAGGLAHIGYWAIDPETLTDRERQKAVRIQGNQLHSTLFHPDQVVPGYEASGILEKDGRRQWVTLRLPDDWNRRLVVCGTPGLRNEYANEAIFVPWLLARGFAVVSGDKGLDSSWVSMLSGTHPTRHWGPMMHDMAGWAQKRIHAVTRTKPIRTYAVGLSNGGYQVRRALEIDDRGRHRRRVFDGGLDWSGTYFPDARVMDTNHNRRVEIEEFHAAMTLVSQMDVATLTMGWAYDPDTLTTPEQFAEPERYPGARSAMALAGFSDPSDIFWGYYNTNYDIYKDFGLPQWQGVGYFNLVSYVYRAELLGHDLAESAVYSCFYDAANPGRPPLYDWLDAAEDGGWTRESVRYALANANTGEFRVPMITVVGTADGLLPIHRHALAYQDAVARHGRPWLYRQYVIENGPHVDAHADGLVDFDFDGEGGNEDAADALTPMQAYAQRAFTYLTDWVERKAMPPENCTVATDPLNDVIDPDDLNW